MENIGISLREYLIKYSQVDRKFIDDFIAIQSSTNDEYFPFVINLEVIVKWLNVNQKGEIKRTLIKSYTENIDYIILLRPKAKQEKKHGGHNKETILVTVLAFKRICLKTKSKMSDQIVNYYLALESLLVEYQKYIIMELIK